MSDVLSRAEVARIAELAHLELTDAEAEAFTRQLGDILAYATQVQALDTSGVPPTSHVLTGAHGRSRRRGGAEPGSADRGDRRARRRRAGRLVPRAAGDRLMAPPSLSPSTASATAIASGDATATSVCEAALERIGAARRRAGRVSRGRGRAGARPRGARSIGCPPALAGPLHGVPDRAQGQPLHARRSATTAASKMLGGYVPPYDATVVDAARAGRRRRRRQGQLRRVRDGLVHRELRVRPDAQSVGPVAHAGRLERRLGRGGRRPAWCRSRSGPTPAGRSASRRRCAASSGSSRPTAASRATA